MKTITTPLKNEIITDLKAGEEVLLSGTIYTARDQAHARLAELVKKGKKLPLALNGAIIYYCGPTSTPKGKVIGSCGPTTSRRMDKFTPVLLKEGLKVMIGKGSRSREAAAAMKKYKAVYFVTYAGCGALLVKYIKKAQAAFFKDLGPEAIYRLRAEKFPLIVAMDSSGRDIYKSGAKKK
jgi:fumarate hydratase subunit beta